MQVPRYIRSTGSVCLSAGDQEVITELHGVFFGAAFQIDTRLAGARFKAG